MNDLKASSLFKLVSLLILLSTAVARAQNNFSCTNAVAMVAGTNYSQDTTGASAGSAAADGCGTNITRGVWYTVTPAIDQRVYITTTGSTFPTELAVYTNDCGSLSNIQCALPYYYGGNGQATISFSSPGNVTYHILAGGLNGQSSVSGTLRILADLQPPPVNDTCAGALPLTNGLTAIMDTTYATELGDGIDSCAAGIAHGVWFTVTPTNNQRVVIDTGGSSFPTQFVVYTNSCGSLSNINCVIPYVYGGNGQANISFSSVANVTYHILVGGYPSQANQSGSLHIATSLVNPPGNDLCAGALPLTSGVTTIMDTTYATELGDGIDSCAAGIARGVWFTVTPTNNQRVVIDTGGSSFPTQFVIYTNTCGSLSNISCVIPYVYGGNGQANISFSSVSNVTYHILVGGYPSQANQSGSLHIATSLVNPPVNDLCAGALPLTNGLTAIMDTTYATELGDGIDSCAAGIARGVWFTVTPTNNQRVVIDTGGSSFPTQFVIYTNTCGSLSNITCVIPYVYGGNGQANISFSSVSNVTYHILVGGYPSQANQSGSLHIATSLVNPPGNDLCAGALPLSSGVTTIMDTTYATELNDNVDSCSGGIAHGVWFTITPPNDERVVIDTSGSSFPTQFAIYTNTCGSLSNVGCVTPYVYSGNGQANISFSSLSNVTYHILAGGYPSQANQSGSLHIVTILQGPPANDLCAGAIAITNNTPIVMDTTYATEQNDNLDSCAANIAHGVWFTVTPTNNQRVIINTTGSTFPTQLSVYTNDCGTLSNILCASPYVYGGNGQASTSFTSVSNVTYHILVGGFVGQSVQSGMLSIAADLENPPANDTCFGALALTSGVTNVMDTTYATELGDNFDSCSGNIAHGVWFTITPTNNQRVILNTAGSAFPTQLAIYTNSCGSLNNVQCSSPYFYNGNGQAGVSFTSLSNITYHVLAGGYVNQSLQSGALDLFADLQNSPANDTCAGAIVLTNGVTNVMDTTYATELGDPAFDCNNHAISHGVWFVLPAFAGQPVTINTCGSSYPTDLMVFTNGCGAPGNAIACSSGSNPFNCNNAGLSFIAPTNLTYYILASGVGAASGMLRIVANVAPPTNDVCSSAVAMTSGVVYSNDTVYATSIGDPTPGCAPGFGRGVWYSYRPSTTGLVGVTTCGSSFPTALAVYAGACGAFTELACSTDNGGYCTAGNAGVNFMGTNGNTYYILAGGVNGQAGNLQLMIPQVDLAPSGLFATNAMGGPITVGKNLLAHWVIQNLGSNSLTGTWNDALSLSNANTNLALANFNFTHAAAAGSNYSENFNGIVPRIPAGNYSLIIQADATGLLAESNKLNNVEILPVFITNSPPSVTLLSPVNQIDRVSCVALPFFLLAQAQAGSYDLTNVFFYDGATNNVIGSVSSAPYSVRSAALGIGTHNIGVVAQDDFGLIGISTNTATITIHYPTNLNVLRADLATNGDFVGCMCGLTGSNYVVETTSNLSEPTIWVPFATNLAGANVLAFTNQPSDAKRYFRVRLLGE